jgi:hypothetical protein
VLVAAAARHGARGVGYELDDELVRWFEVGVVDDDLESQDPAP